MAQYQASVGQRVFYDTAYTMANKTEIAGLTQTPDKGGSPSEVSVNIISEYFVRNLAGQQEMPVFEYSFVPDFTAETGNMAKMGLWSVMLSGFTKSTKSLPMLPSSAPVFFTRARSYPCTRADSRRTTPRPARSPSTLSAIPYISHSRAKRLPMLTCSTAKP